MSKHTPGPWQVTNTLGKVAITVPHDSIGIAPYTVCHIWPHIEKGESEANAKLIAAAPELLETVKELVEIFEQINTNGMFAYHLDSHTGVKVKKANEIIRKAEGK